MSKLLDLTGMRFGRLTVIKRAENVVQQSGETRTAWRCKCDCGAEIVARSTDLRTGKKKSCGCYRREFRVHDLTGQKFGRLTAIKPIENNGHGIEWLCKCDCGNETVVRCDGLVTGHASSCGCYNRELKRNYSHGMSNTKIYRVWCGMKQRCNNPNNQEYHRYGGRGIKICKEWNDDFDKFGKWALSHGYKQGLQIDRINNNGDYEPSNCRFVTPLENMHNRGY